MNTRPAIESSSNPVALSASFNQDASCFSVGLNTGFCSMPALAFAKTQQKLTSRSQYLTQSHASSECLEVQSTKTTHLTVHAEQHRL
jgi:hypothetical protein